MGNGLGQKEWSSATISKNEAYRKAIRVGKIKNNRLYETIFLFVDKLLIGNERDFYVRM
jgi:hypothetical protein